MCSNPGTQDVFPFTWIFTFLSIMFIVFSIPILYFVVKLKYVILCDAIVNEIVFLVSLFGFSLLVYKNTVDFWILTQYLIT